VAVAYTALVDALANVLNSTSLAVVSYYSKQLNPVPPHERTVPLVTPVSGISVNLRWDTQRRRAGRT
jgi:hypothetical protein